MRVLCLAFTSLLALIALTGCAALTGTQQSLAVDKNSKAAVAAAAFGPDRRLWRLIVTGQQLYVDSSADHGATYSTPVPVNPQPQPILAQAEDRPSLAVDARGWIYVLYSSGTLEMPVTYLSYSMDGGRHFSIPVRIGDPDHPTKHYQDVMAVDPSGQIYLFWNDEQGKESSSVEKEGAALYYATLDRPGGSPLAMQKLKDGLCNCCRIAVDFDIDGLPVIFARFVLEDHIRDHGMLKVSRRGLLGKPWRVTEDDWKIEACPMHGPALAIAPDGRYHIAWFTQGGRRQGLSYAYSDDQGRRFSSPVSFGNNEHMAQHADVLALIDRVVLVWKEFDGKKTRVMAMQSRDRGGTWSSAAMVADSASESDYPFVITDGKGVFLSWNAEDHGYRLIPIQ